MAWFPLGYPLQCTPGAVNTSIPMGRGGMVFKGS